MSISLAVIKMVGWDSLENCEIALGDRVEYVGYLYNNYKHIFFT